MTRYHDPTSIVNRLVIAFDICSSTSILERLKHIDSLGIWENFLVNLKDVVVGEGERYGVELYKFMGDGWILLLPRDTPTNAACSFLQRISMSFHLLFEQNIGPLLGTHINPIGLTFGIDAGELVGLTMNERQEYLGRPINVACRLQAYTREIKGGPEYKALFSMNSFNRPMLPPPTFSVEPMMVSLRNISPADIECLVFQTYQVPKVVVRRSASAPTISYPSYQEHLGKKGEILLNRLSAIGKRLMRHLVENEPLEVGRRFMNDVSLDDQFQQLTIAMDMGIIRHQEVRAGSGMIVRTDYHINPQFVPVLQDLLYRNE